MHFELDLSLLIWLNNTFR